MVFLDMLPQCIEIGGGIRALPTFERSKFRFVPLHTGSREKHTAGRLLVPVTEASDGGCVLPDHIGIGLEVPVLLLIMNEDAFDRPVPIITVLAKKTSQSPQEGNLSQNCSAAREQEAEGNLGALQPLSSLQLWEEPV